MRMNWRGQMKAVECFHILNFGLEAGRQMLRTLQRNGWEETFHC